jgi:hypothetical protein
MPIYNNEGERSPCPGCGNSSYPNLEKKEVASLRMESANKLSGNRSKVLGEDPDSKRPAVLNIKTVWSCRNCGWVAVENG